MATLEEIYAKIVSDDTEKKALAEAFATEEGARGFMEQRGCEASPVELVALMREKAGAAGELADEDLEGAAGGTGWDWFVSIVGIGFSCAFWAGVSAAADASDTVAEALFVNPHSDKESYFDLCDKVRPE